VIRYILLAAALAGTAAPLQAQTAAPAPRIEFLPRAVFHMSAELLSGIDDPRFRWDANFGGELDVIDYGVGRFTFGANYEVIMGEELRAFDPNQGNYILEGSLSARLPAAEVAAVMYHQSRHLSDRPKTVPIDWNMLGARVRRAFLAGATHLEVRGDVRRTFMQSFVDYRWELDGRLRGDHLLRPGFGVMFAAGVRHLTVDGSRDRGGQTGYRAEAGIRADGGAGAVELFAGVERRIDPYQLEFGTATWATAGFRLLTR
jgi:hypothetical protein